jgi:RNA polymerase sigma-70 factor (ECF subfamily)
LENELELIIKAKNGDKHAFGELALFYRKNICGLAYRFTGNLSEAEDITQDVLVRAYLALSGFIPSHPGAFKSWLLTITSRICIDYSRRNRNRNLEVDIQPGQESALSETLESVPDIIARKEIRQLVQQALHRLPPNYRMAVALKYLEDLDYRQIAEITGAPLGTVGTWIRRGLSLLRSDLQAKGVVSDAQFAVK